MRETYRRPKHLKINYLSALLKSIFTRFICQLSPESFFLTAVTVYWLYFQDVLRQTNIRSRSLQQYELMGTDSSASVWDDINSAFMHELKSGHFPERVHRVWQNSVRTRVSLWAFHGTFSASCMSQIFRNVRVSPCETAAGNSQPGSVWLVPESSLLFGCCECCESDRHWIFHMSRGSLRMFWKQCLFTQDKKKGTHCRGN